MVYYNKALACERMGETEQALSAYQYFLEQVPATNVFAKDANKRVEILRRILEQRRETTIHFTRGNGYRTHGFYEKAIVIKMDSNLVMAYYNKALALEHIGQKEKAIEAYLSFIQRAQEGYALYVEIAKRRFYIIYIMRTKAV
ncbi:MAG: tetratricopeptide repeat protein [Atribacterota bacterium]